MEASAKGVADVEEYEGATRKFRRDDAGRS
jgi:hypothetical protein